MITFRLFMPLAILVLSGCASTSAYHNPQDPLEPLNRSVYRFNDTVDRAVLKPVAKGYNAVMPTGGKIMVRNFFSNLDDFLVTMNDLLQFKLRQAFSDGGRVLINSTVGAFGLVDVASATGYPKHDEDFGQTLGVWGFGSGPYLVLPIFGPSSFRDGIGLYVDGQESRITNLKDMRTRNQLYLAEGVTTRADLLNQEKMLDQAVLDRYSFIRDAYLMHRQSLVYDGNPPRPKYDDEDDEDDGAAPSAPATQNKAVPGPSSGNAPAAPAQ
jgi:phospholipid-binding lipoprotein MlaA